MKCFHPCPVKITGLTIHLFAALFFGTLTPSHAATSSKLPVVPKWGRFELSLKSSVTYSDPLTEATLSAVFVSPLGETNRVFGFWDGGKIWRVRFSPNAPGRWRFTTACSDKSNAKLDNQSGAFICTAPLTKTAIERHGPLRVARDRRHFEHADGKPFLWLGDRADDAARSSTFKEWELYATLRGQQRFNASHWILAPGRDEKGESAFITTNGFAININFFQRLDAKVDALNRAGLLSAIVPLQEFGSAKDGLTEQQATTFLRYVVARWGANHVAWLLAFESDALGKNADRWKRIGRAVFAHQAHAPVILLPGETYWLLDEFRGESWVDAFGFPTIPTNDDSLQWMFTGPLSVEWQKPPPRPILNLTPSAETIDNSDIARHLLWWNSLLHPTAGTAYGASGVMNWTTNATTDPNIRPRDLPQWREAVFQPGAKSVTKLAELFETIDALRLQPAPDLVLNQPGLQSPRRHVAAATTATRDLTVIYVPEDRSIQLPLSALSKSPIITWINPRTAERSKAVALVEGDTCRFPTPDAGDWLLLLKRKN